MFLWVLPVFVPAGFHAVSHGLSVYPYQALTFFTAFSTASFPPFVRLIALLFEWMEGVVSKRFVAGCPSYRIVRCTSLRCVDNNHSFIVPMPSHLQSTPTKHLRYSMMKYNIYNIQLSYIYIYRLYMYIICIDLVSTPKGESIWRVWSVADCFDVGRCASRQNGPVRPNPPRCGRPWPRSVPRRKWVFLSSHCLKSYLSSQSLGPPNSLKKKILILGDIRFWSALLVLVFEPSGFSGGFAIPWHFALCKPDFGS